MQVFREDVKAGLFIVIALLTFTFAVLKVGGMLDQLRPGRDVIMNFENTNGLVEGNPIQYRGKKIGTVQEIRFADLGQSIDVVASIDPDLVLYEGTVARIADKSVLGGKLVTLVPPDASGGLQPLADDAIIPGEPSVGLDTILVSLQSMLDDYRGRIDGLLGQAEIVLGNVDGGIHDLRTQVNRFGELQPEAKEALVAYTTLAKELSVKADALIIELTATLEAAKPATIELRDEFVALAQESKQSLNEITIRLNRLLETSDRTVDRADSILVDNYAELNQTIRALKETVRNLEYFSAAIAEKPNRLLFGKPLPVPAPDTDARFDRELRRSGVLERKDMVEDEP